MKGFLTFNLVTSMEFLTIILIIGKEFLEYYVIYDLEDNIVAYCDNLEELSRFTNRRKREFKYRFKDRDVLLYLYYDTYRKIYKFLDN